MAFLDFLLNYHFELILIVLVGYNLYFFYKEYFAINRNTMSDEKLWHRYVILEQVKQKRKRK